MKKKPFFADRDDRFNPGICLLCGEHFNVLLHCHSQAHGYADAYAQINDKKVKFDWELRDENKRF